MPKSQKQILIRNIVAAVALFISAHPSVWATPTAQYVTGLTVTAVSVDDWSGEVLDISVEQTVVAGCAAATGYVVRDSAVINGSLALVMSALLAGRTIDVYVSGTCDASGNPNVVQVIMH